MPKPPIINAQLAGSGTGAGKNTPKLPVFESNDGASSGPSVLNAMPATGIPVERYGPAAIIEDCIEFVITPPRPTGWLPVLGVVDDGAWGPVSAAALARADESDLLMRFLAARIRFMTRLSNWQLHGAGWMNRIAGQLDYGAEDTP